MTEEKSGKERRLYPRAEGEFAVIFNLTMPIPVNMDTGTDEYPAVALDVSEGGIGLDVDRPLPVGEAVKLRFELVNSKTELDTYRLMFFKLEGEVRYCAELKKQHFHVGVQFSQVTPEQREFIATYIKDFKLDRS